MVAVGEMVVTVVTVVVKAFVGHNRIEEPSYTTIDSPFGEKSELGC